MKWEISDKDIEEVEKLLLNEHCHFDDNAKSVIRCWESREVSACPGSGKTTILLAKLKLLADRIPLENGAGICVLSHTNVAVDEIIRSLANYAGILMSYPNFIGTIQSFIDKFVTIPYLKQYSESRVEIVDNHTWAQHFWRYVLKNYSDYSSFIKLVKSRYHHWGDNSSKDKFDYIAGFYQKDGCLFHSSTKIANCKADSSIQYLDAKESFLKSMGMITYSDSYKYALKAIAERQTLRNLLSNRFRYVFVDEFQDCREDQRQIIDLLFDPSICMLMRFGDPDQAIYDSDGDENTDWTPDGNALHISTANRYSQDIANVLAPLRKTKKQIISTQGTISVPPTLIVFREDEISKVLPTFSSLLDKYNIMDGKIKAIGWVTKSKCLKIGDYWSGFEQISKAHEDYTYWGTVKSIVKALNEHKLYLVEKELRHLIVRILKLIDYRDADGNRYTIHTIRKKLDEEYFQQYRCGILDFCLISPITEEAVDQKIKDLVNSIISYRDRDVFSRLPHFYMGDNETHQILNENVYIDQAMRRIDFCTVHKAKGETHEATLYLETVSSRASDISRILPHYQGIPPKKEAIHERNRKIVYVGFSRPKKLLCLAIREETYKKSGGAFERNGWTVVMAGDELNN